MSSFWTIRSRSCSCFPRFFPRCGISVPFPPFRTSWDNISMTPRLWSVRKTGSRSWLPRMNGRACHTGSPPWNRTVLKEQRRKDTHAGRKAASQVFDIDCRHLVQEIDERNLVPHGELPGRYGHEHADDRSIDRVLGEVVADGKSFGFSGSIRLKSKSSPERT